MSSFGFGTLRLVLFIVLFTFNSIESGLPMTAKWAAKRKQRQERKQRGTEQRALTGSRSTQPKEVQVVCVTR